MDLNYITKGKALPLGVIIIIVTFLVSGASTSIVPYVFFTGILMGIIKSKGVVEAAVTGLITALLGSIISMALYMAIVMMSYGSEYAGYVLGSSFIIIILYLIVGIVGGAIGYFVKQELDSSSN